MFYKESFLINEAHRYCEFATKKSVLISYLLDPFFIKIPCWRGKLKGFSELQKSSVIQIFLGERAQENKTMYQLKENGYNSLSETTNTQERFYPRSKVLIFFENLDTPIM